MGLKRKKSMQLANFCFYSPWESDFAPEVAEVYVSLRTNKTDTVANPVQGPMADS